MKAIEAKVLLIEDDPNIRTTLKLMLEEMGIHNITETINGIEALQYIDEHTYEINLIICDWNMPKKTGIEFLREVRQVFPTMPFVMITARADKDSVLLAQAENVTAYVSKPVSFDALKKKIDHVLNQ